MSMYSTNMSIADSYRIMPDHSDADKDWFNRFNADLSTAEGRNKFIYNDYYKGDQEKFYNELTEFKNTNRVIKYHGDRIGNFNDLYEAYSEEWAEFKSSDILGEIFGADITGILGSDSYEIKRRKRTKVLQAMLGDEMASIGRPYDKVESLADFAEYTQKELSAKEKFTMSGNKYSPLKRRKEELEEIASGKIKYKVGQETRDFLKKTGNMPIGGLKSATGTSEGSSAMQSSFARQSATGSAQNAMSERVSQLLDKQEATKKLSKMITDQFEYDIKRRQELTSTRAKAAVGLAGAELTAYEHARELAKITG